MRDHCTLLLTDCDLTSFFYLFISSFLFNLSYLRVPTLILGCFHSVYTINCWSSGLATSTWTYWAARSLVGLIAKLLLLPRPVLLLPLLKKKMHVKREIMWKQNICTYNFQALWVIVFKIGNLICVCWAILYIFY